MLHTLVLASTACFAGADCKNRKAVACFAQTATPCAAHPSTHFVDVAINANDRVFIGSEPVALSGVHAYFERLAQKSPHATVRIMADRDAHYGTVLQVLDAAKHAGIRVLRAER